MEKNIKLEKGVKIAGAMVFELTMIEPTMGHEEDAMTMAVNMKKLEVPLTTEVSVTSPSPGLMDVRFILKSNVLPDLATIALVHEALSASDVRPLTDNVTVSAPTVVDFQVDITWYISEKNSSLDASISLAKNKAVNTYILWQKSQIGRDINPSELIRLVMEAGAKRVEVTLPEYTQIDVTALAVAMKKGQGLII